MKASGRVEYIFVDVEEDIEIKLQAQHFTRMPSIQNPCSNDLQYSAPKCGEICIWKQITNAVQCSAPWMPDIKLADCSNYMKMCKLISSYTTQYDEEVEPHCNCYDPCKSTIYSTFVQNRKEFKQPSPRTQIWIYFTSKLVTIVEEKPGYDLSQFVADMGGSLGFLLGLSVLGLIGILESVALIIFGDMIKKRILKRQSLAISEENGSGKESVRDNSSATTVEIATIQEKEIIVERS